MVNVDFRCQSFPCKLLLIGSHLLGVTRPNISKEMRIQRMALKINFHVIYDNHHEKPDISI